jgi:regulator of nucleoside diphosphate kinase
MRIRDLRQFGKKPMKTPSIMVTQENHARLSDLLSVHSRPATQDHEHLSQFRREIERALIVPSSLVDPDVITMNSRVKVRELDTASATVYTLVYPEEADASRGRVSVLAPLGAALLGFREGDIIAWETPGGMKRWKVELLLYQPEAAGEASCPCENRPAETAHPVQ